MVFLGVQKGSAYLRNWKVTSVSKVDKEPQMKLRYNILPSFSVSYFSGIPENTQLLS